MNSNVNKHIRIWVTIAFSLYFFLEIYGVQFGPEIGNKFSPSGIKAIIHYELGHFAYASEYWRENIGMVHPGEVFAGLEEVIRKDIENDPDNPMNFLRLGDMYLYYGHYDEALEVFSNAPRGDKYDGDFTFAMAAALAFMDRYREAADYYREGLKAYNEETYLGFINSLAVLDYLLENNNNSDPDLLLLTAYIYRYLTIYDERADKPALKYSDKVIALDPSAAEAYFTKGVVLRKQDKDDEAKQQFIMSIEADPSYADAYRRLSDIYEDEGNPGAELDALRNAEENSADDGLFPYLLGRQLERKYGAYAEAMEYYRKAYERDPANIDYADDYGTILLKLDHTETAVQIANDMIARHPDQKEGYILIAYCFIDMKLPGRAITAFLDAHKAEPLEADDAKYMAFELSKLKYLQEAIDLLGYALSKQPYDEETLINIVNLFMQTGQYQEAYDASKYALSMYPENEAILGLLPYIEDNLEEVKSP